MTTTATATDRAETAVLAAMRYMATRQVRLENVADEDSHVGQYRIGKADGFAESIELLAETTGVNAGEYLDVDPMLRFARDLGCAWDAARDALEPAAFAAVTELFAQVAQAIPGGNELT